MLPNVCGTMRRGLGVFLKSVLPIHRTSIVALALFLSDDSGVDHPALRLAAPLGSAQGERAISSVQWDTVFQIGGTDTDTVLLAPRIIAARGALYVFDTGDRRLKAFDGHGKLKWKFGGPGQGPGEFENVVDIEVDQRGNVWISDGALGRVTIVSDAGAQRRHFTIQNGTLRHIVPMSRGLISTQVVPNRFLAVFDETGQELRQLPSPRRDISEAAPTARQVFTAVAEDGRSWVAMFPFASPLVGYRNESVSCIGSLVEGGSFQVPRSGLRPDIWAVSVAVSDSTIYVLPRGKTDHAFRILDEYSLNTCRYRKSINLPRKAVAIAVTAGTLMLAFDEPAPGVLAIRPRLRK